MKGVPIKLLFPGSTVESPNTNTAGTAGFLFLPTRSITLLVEITTEMLIKTNFNNLIVVLSKLSCGLLYSFARCQPHLLNEDMNRKMEMLMRVTYPYTDVPVHIIILRL